jgi:hypothetical protein
MLPAGGGRQAQVDGATAEAQKLPNYEDFEAVPADEKALGIAPKK